MVCVQDLERLLEACMLHEPDHSVVSISWAAHHNILPQKQQFSTLKYMLRPCFPTCNTLDSLSHPEVKVITPLYEGKCSCISASKCSKDSRN